MSIKLTVPDNNLTPELKPRITVIGVGGAGGNAVNNMIASHLEGVDFVVANTDAQALALSRTDRRVQMGLGITDGLGAGANPHVGQTAANETLEEIMAELDGSHMVFVAAGMGGGTGTGAAPVIARAARERGILTVGVVTKPFHFEGAHRMRLAEGGIEELQSVVDTLIIIPNQNLFRVANEKTTFADAFKMADDVLHSGVRSVTDLMVMPGLINLDFADVQAIMAGMGKAMMGTGEAEGEKRALDAAEAAISNPLLEDTSIKGAQGVLINITGGPDMTLFEVDEAANRIRDEVDQDAHIIFGSTFDEKLEGLIRVSVVATGIDTVAMSRPEPRVLELTAKERITPTQVAPAAVPEVAAVATAQAENPVEAEAADPIQKEEMPAVAKAVNSDAQTGEAPFIPAPPMQPSGRRFTPRKAEPFNQAAMENKPAEPVAEKKASRPRMTLFERVTGVGRTERAPAPKPAPEPKAEPAPVAQAVPETPKPAPAAMTKEEREPQLLPGERAVTSYEEEDMLDIPAFLRRQAN